MIQRALVVFFTFLFVTPIVIGCAGMMRTPEAVLEDQLRAFHAHLRWGRIEEASTFVADGHRQVFLGMHEELGDEFEVTEFEIEMINVDRASDTAEVTVWMQWFRLPSTRVEDATYRETWGYNEEARVWMLDERVEID
ncbi:MAG: hypothetical protein ACJAYU_000942 [Bradymonadia bacterium]|jgi:hypothetical protein